MNSDHKTLNQIQIQTNIKHVKHALICTELSSVETCMSSRSRRLEVDSSTVVESNRSRRTKEQQEQEITAKKSTVELKQKSILP